MALCPPHIMDDGGASHTRRSGCHRRTFTADAAMTGTGDHAGRQHTRSDANSNTLRQLSWLTIGVDGRETTRSHYSKPPDWKVGGWVGGLCVKLKEIGGESKTKIKMFKKKREIIKTPSISKRSRAGSPSSQSVSSEQPKKAGDLPDGASPTLSSSSAATLSPPCFGNSTVSCPGTPNVQHGRQGASASSSVSGGPLKRPSTLSRHASAAGFPLQSWVFSKGYHHHHHQKGTLVPSPSQESVESVVSIEAEDIPLLLRDVARFAEAVEKLKDVVLGEGKLENRRPLAHECLGEVLRVFKQVIAMYPLLNTVETLTAAGKLISKVKGFHYETSNDVEKKDFEKAIETIAVAFSSNVSELLMGELDSSSLLSVPPTEKSRSMENLYGASSHGLDTPMRNDLFDSGTSPEEVDIILQRSEGGVDTALAYAKTISKYMKDLISYAEKRTALEVEFAKGLHRLYQSSKQSITLPHMPLYSVYSQALEQDMEQSAGVQQASVTVQNKTFIQPLLQRKLEHEKKRKELKESWNRARRKLMECETNLRKTKQTYIARFEEYDKAKSAACKAEEEGSSSTAKSVDKKKKLEDDARNKAEDAEASYKLCIADTVTHHEQLEDLKVTVLRQIQELIKQSDQTLRSVTISYFSNMQQQTVGLPVHYQSLCENSKMYDPGQQYATHVKELQMPLEPEISYVFEPYSEMSSSTPQSRPRNDSFNTEGQGSADAADSADGSGSVSSKGDSKKGRGHLTHKSWGSTVSDTDSVEAGGSLGSPTTSTGDISKMARTSSTGTMSSNEDTDEKEVATFESPNLNGMEPEIPVPTGPFRNIGLSKAAQTHKLRKLRSPAKCRECDSYVYFQGAECEECYLACHKRCLETMAIQCGHKKLQGRLQLFGRDFSQVTGGSTDGIPFIVKKCICEIERRALRTKGIYRVNGVKTRVEKLCQAFENGKELVELSQCSPHDISNVLKLYLRQLPEPIICFQLYNSLMGLAKESMQAEEGGETGKGPELKDQGPNTSPEVLALVERLKEQLAGIPKDNHSTLRYIARHLHRIAELEEDNKMSPNNLGIVFGPSLMRPRPTGATVSLSSLVDYPLQARIVEMLIVFYLPIFPSNSSSSSTTHSGSTTGHHTAATTQQQDGSVTPDDSGSADGASACDEHGGVGADTDTLPDEEGTAGGGGDEGAEQSLDSEADTELEADTTGEEGHAQQQASDTSAEEEHHGKEEEEEEGHPEESSSSGGGEGGHPGPTPVILLEPDSQEGEGGDADPTPPALPETEPPELDDPDGGPEEGSTLATLNTNQSNNCLLRIEPAVGVGVGVCVSPYPKSGARRLSVYKDQGRDGKVELI
ncbi:rho GTPase-activating protein 45 isoform X2 [Engraulis encrasicolus]|uniref:rho GTPase-activating protein 45 isoform X2 n=1 Tax=Engraulis encrasicolus TaxID=184585 RepID=UPI002FD44C7B